MPYPVFDRSKLRIKPLSERQHDLDLSHLWQLDDDIPAFDHPDLAAIADRIAAAYRRRGMVILMMGAHLLRAGASRFIIDLMHRGVIKHIGMNGAGPIHDYELALIGATTESVARYIRSGEFGLWEETGRINEIVARGYAEGLGYGEAVGRAIHEGDFPYKEVSILAAAYRMRVPVTVHIGIGYDIIHEHPNCDGAALGGASYRDFLTLAYSIEQLEGGVFLSSKAAYFSISAAR